MSFGQDLLAIRSRYKLSQDEVARALGVSRTTVGEIEKGQRDIKLSELDALAKLIDSDVCAIISDSAAGQQGLAKFREMILRVATSYKRQTGKDIPKTFLAKLVYLVDFAWFYEQLEPMSGLAYRRLAHGPVADGYFSSLGELVDAGKLDAKQGRDAQWYAPALTDEAPSVPEYLSLAECELIDAVVRKWKDASTAEIVEFTHRQLPWQVCFPGEVIPYELITQEEPDCVY